MLLFSSLVSAKFVFRNPDREPFSMVEIVEGFESYKSSVKFDKCVSKDYDWLKFSKKCVEKYSFGFGAFIWSLEVERFVLGG